MEQMFSGIKISFRIFSSFPLYVSENHIQAINGYELRLKYKQVF